MRNPHDVFISYSRKDLAAVKCIRDELEECGFSCWMDLAGIVSGTRRFSKAIIEAIDASRTLLFFLSSNSQMSDWALKEIDYATEEKKNVVLVRFSDDPMTKEFRFDFGRTDIVDWRVPEQKEKLLRDLAGWSGIQQPRSSQEIGRSHGGWRDADGNSASVVAAAAVPAPMAPLPQNGDRVFISYHHTDRQNADIVKSYVEKLGYSCWMAPESLKRDVSKPFDSDVQDQTFLAIRESKCLLFVLSPRSLGSYWVRKEVQYALSECRKPVIPFLVDPISEWQSDDSLFVSLCPERQILNQEGANKGMLVLSVLDAVLKRLFT